MVEITDADTHGDFTGVNVSPSDGTENFREGTSFAAIQANQEVWDAYVSFTAADYSDRTIFGWEKVSAPAAEGDATGAGFSIYLDDGSGASESRSYDVGGSDNYGFFFQGWSCWRLNTAGLPTGFRQVDGTLEPDLTNLTDIGMGGYFPSKAVGNAPNCGIDIMRYVANANPALLIEGGTTGDRGTFQEIADADAATTAAYGVCRGLITGANAFEIQFGIHMGSLDATAYFDDSDFQVFLNGEVAQGGTIAAGSMDFDFVGWASGTNVINFENFLFQGVGAVSNWDMSDTNIDELIWTGGQFVDMGTFLFQAQDAGSKTLTNLTFTNCGQVTFVGIDADNITFNGTTDALGAVFWDASSVEENQDNLTFVSDGTGHAIEISLNTASLTTYNIDGYSVSGYEAADDTGTGNTVFLVDNALDGDVTINVSNGTGTFSYERAAGYTGTVTVDAAVTVTLTGLVNDTEVTVYDSGTGALIDEVEDVIGNEFAFSDAASNVVDIFIHKEDYYRADILGFTIPGTNTSIPVSQLFDPNYQNPT